MEAYPDPHKPQNKPWENNNKEQSLPQDLTNMFKIQNKNLVS